MLAHSSQHIKTTDFIKSAEGNNGYWTVSFRTWIFKELKHKIQKYNQHKPYKHQLFKLDSSAKTSI